MGKNGVTINDVAKRGGVSKVTVSYVLNGRETAIRISDETRARVLAAARELGYHPNALARGLARKQTDTLTLVMQYPAVFSGGSGFINELMHGASDKACELGYDLMLHTKPQPDWKRDVSALTDGRADGALVLRDLDDPLADALNERGFPCVQIFSRSETENACTVDCDNVQGGRLATEHLLKLGHTRIGHIGGSQHSASAIDRLTGYRQALMERGVSPRAEWECVLTYADGDVEPLRQMLSLADAPTALFAWSDDAAIRAIRLIQDEMGRRVPGDVALVGFDGTELGAHTSPPLTSVRQPIYEMAARGVELLASRIRRQPDIQTQTLFPPELLVRQSCGAFYSSTKGNYHESLL